MTGFSSQKAIRRMSAMLFCLFLVMPSMLWADNTPENNAWPGWRGLNNTAIVTGTGLFQDGGSYGFKERWRRPLGSGYSGVSIADGIAVTMFSDKQDDYVIALDAQTGEEKWRYRIDITHLGRFGSADGPISTPLIADGNVYGLGPRGQLFALDAKTGKALWSHHLVEEYGVKSPLVYGFSTSPIRYNNVLILETSNPDGSAVTGFDLNSGEVLWKAGNDSVGFQSPVLMDVNGKTQLICAATSYLYGMNPQIGQILWEYKHSEKAGFAGMNLNPVPLGNNRIFVKKLQGKLKTIQVNEVEGQFSVEESWESQNLQRSYVVPVVHDGNIFGLNGRFFSCFDAETGKTLWKSRQPGDGFPIMVDGHLITVTKDGTLHLAKASPEGYSDMASLAVFEGICWTPPSFADGKVYLRSFTDIVCVDVVSESMPAVADEGREKTMGVIPTSDFAKFVASVENAENKSTLLDVFMARQSRFPVIEGNNMVHIVYRGEAEEMALSSEHIGNRIDPPMNHIPDTDFFYYSFFLEPDARITYRLLRNTDERMNDSLNSETLVYRPGRDASVITMPEWQVPSHFDPPTGKAGRVDTVSMVSSLRGDTLQMHVYLPTGYDSTPDRRYASAYVIDGRGVQEMGMLNHTLDNLIGKTVEPLIVVYVYPNFGGWYIEYVGDNRDKHFEMLTKEIMPHIDASYRTIADPASRAAIGADDAGFMAIYAATKNPGTFGKIGLHSATWGDLEASLVRSQMIGADKQPLTFYLDWGKYDAKSPMEGWNVTEANRQLATFLKTSGYEFTGGEVNEGDGWPSWRNRNDRLLETLFPLR